MPKEEQPQNSILLKVEELLNKMDQNPVEIAGTNDINPDNFRYVMKEIKAISEECRTTRIYLENQDKIRDMINFIKSDTRSPDKSVKSAWMQLLSKTINAPTQLHLITSTIFWFPILEKLLLEYFTIQRATSN